MISVLQNRTEQKDPRGVATADLARPHTNWTEAGESYLLTAGIAVTLPLSIPHSGRDLY
jgi:hypothetical protein